MSGNNPTRNDAAEFMLEEYKQIAAAFFDLLKQRSDMFRFYLALITIPISLIAAIMQIEKSSIYLFDLPDLVILVLFAIAIAGLITTAIVVDIRFESILYAKTINLTRRYFRDKGGESELGKYLLLPDGDDLPRFYEQPWEITKGRWRWELGVGATFLEILLMGLLDSVYLGLPTINILHHQLNLTEAILFGSAVGVAFFLLHIIGYLYFARKRDNEWITKQSSTQ